MYAARLRATLSWRQSTTGKLVLFGLALAVASGGQGPGYSFHLSPLYVEHPSIRFHAPDAHDRRPLDLPDALPIRQPADRPAALLIHPDDRWVYEQAQRLFTPLPRSYSVEWVGALKVEQAGAYKLALRATGWAQLTLDGETVVVTYAPGVGVAGTVLLEQGFHDLQVRYRDTVERSRLHLLWQPPGQAALVAIPSQVLWPARPSALESAWVNTGRGGRDAREN